MPNNKQISAHLKMKQDTTQNWDTSSLVPQLGEPLLYRDGETGAIYGLKFGDGVHTPANLEFIGNDIVVDSALSTTSTNPVQNGIITISLNGKLNEKSFSNNPPTWVDPTSFIEDDPESANKHRILAGIYAVDENNNQVLVPFSMAGGARVDGEPEGSETDPNGTPLGIPTFVMYNRANQVLVCKATNVKHAVPLGQLQDFLAGKLDKVAATAANGKKVYGTGANGTPYMYAVLRTVEEMETTSGGVLGRADNGKFVVPTPTAANDISNKGYVDSAVVGKLDKVAVTTANARKLYGTSNTGDTYMWKVLRTVADMQTTEGGIMGRADNGHFVVPTPTANDDIANKKYVDDHAGGATWHSASTSSITLNAATYHIVVCFYHGHGSADNYDTSTIVIGPDLAYSIQCRGTTDGQGQYVTASNADIDTYDLTLSAPSGCTFVGYFIS